MTDDRYARACSQLFEPFTMRRFFAEIWPSRYFADEPREERLAALESLLGRADRDSLLAAHEPVGPAHVYREQDGTMGEEILPPRSARERLAFANVLLKEMHVALPSLGSCARMMAATCGLPAELCVAHVHVSGPGIGFIPHFDDKDVLTFQLRGTKTWWVGELPFIEAPTIDYVPGAPPSPELAVYWPSAVPLDGSFRPSDGDLRRVDLTPGSMLFVPRGHWHRTTEVDESVSVAFGFSSKCWADVAAEKLRRRLIEHAAWRRPVHGVSPDAGARRVADARAATAPLLPMVAAAARDLEEEGLVGPTGRDR